MLVSGLLTDIVPNTVTAPADFHTLRLHSFSILLKLGCAFKMITPPYLAGFSAFDEIQMFHSLSS